MGVGVSVVEEAVGWDREAGRAPLAVTNVDEGWVMGFVPWVHAFCGGGFLQGRRISGVARMEQEAGAGESAA